MKFTSKWMDPKKKLLCEVTNIHKQMLYALHICGSLFQILMCKYTACSSHRHQDE